MNYATLFDRNYLPHGLALLESMYAHCQPFTLHVLALDDETMERVSSLPCVRAYSLQDFEALHDLPLGDIRVSRSWKEYCWTLEPVWVHNRLHACDEIIYIDSDCYFFSSPQRHVLSIKPHHEIGLCPHNFPNGSRTRQKGRYNFGFAYFRKTDRVTHLVKDWMNAAIEECDGQSCGHQQQLDAWPETMGDGLFEFDRSINCGPWQHASIRSYGGTPHVIEESVGDPLVMYHFHEFRRGSVGPNVASHNGVSFNMTHYPLRDETELSVYRPYLDAVSAYSEAE